MTAENGITAESTLIKVEDKEQKISCRERLKKFFRHVTVEPLAMVLITSSVLSAITSQTLYLDKTCRVNLNLGNHICDALRKKESDNYNNYEKLVQKYVAPRLAWRSVIQSVLPCIMLPFIGSWSDFTGKRKIVIILPLIGEVFQGISNILNVIFFYQIPVEVTMFLDAFLPGVTGGWSTIFIGLYSYIGDITTQENRTHRLGFVGFSSYIGVPLGLCLSGIMTKHLGYLVVYTTCFTLNVLCFLYLIFFITDPRRSTEQIMEDGRGVSHFLKTFFVFKNVTNTIKVIFKDGPGRRRFRIIIMLSVVTLLFGPMYGELSIMYMSTRYRFNWDELQFSIFQTYNSVAHTCGTLFSIIMFSKVWKWHDSVLGIISTLSKIAASFIYCFAKTASLFYLAPAVEILSGTSMLSMRSILSKLVATDELGKLNSVIGLVENLMPLIYVPLYTNVYTASMHVLPGAVFLMGASMTLPAVAVFIGLFIEYRKSLKITEIPLNDSEIPLQKDKIDS